MNQRPLTEEEKAELAALNAYVADAIAARRDWLDAKMVETSKLQVGDDIYKLRSGAKVGTVTKLYRFWRDRDDGIRDTTVGCHYEYQASPGYRDNTSRQSEMFGTREDARVHAERRAKALS